MFDATPDAGGFYFAGPSLSPNVAYFVQVCKGTTAIANRTIAPKLAKNAFDEEDFSGLP